MDSPPPFELYPQGSGGFVCFELHNERMALPYLALEKVIMTDESCLKFSFGSRSIFLSGSGLSALFEHLLLIRIKVIRCGKSGICAVNQISLYEE